MGIILKHALVAFIFVSGVAMAAPPPPPENDKAASVPAPMATKLFVVVYRQGPKWKVGQPMHKQALGGHVQYYRRAMQNGQIFAGGGLVAINGGLAILKMSSLDEAKAFLAADPALLNGTFVGEVHSWTPNPGLLTGEPLKP